MRILLTATAVALALPMLLPLPAMADLAIYIEDFEHNGELGFDPMFNHSFQGHNGYPPWWKITDNAYPRPGDPMLLLGATDTIMIDIGSHQSIVYASVEAFGTYSSDTVAFIGEHATVTFSDWWPKPTILSITSAQIGEIRAIRLCGGESLFDNITFGVVPEPSASIALLMMLTMSGGVMGLLRKSRSR